MQATILNCSEYYPVDSIEKLEPSLPDIKFAALPNDIRMLAYGFLTTKEFLGKITRLCKKERYTL